VPLRFPAGLTAMDRSPRMVSVRIAASDWSRRDVAVHAERHLGAVSGQTDRLHLADLEADT